MLHNDVLAYAQNKFSNPLLCLTVSTTLRERMSAATVVQDILQPYIDEPDADSSTPVAQRNPSNNPGASQVSEQQVRFSTEANLLERVVSSIFFRFVLVIFSLICKFRSDFQKVGKSLFPH